ncbi:hypothetical protein [Bathymodiolus japonicus methanotrophic gill symbiont]|uniref:hypothetical protein n=1 Tax=Bathymodiolus japonicus methanotrophic gill symbiont TaxID=113269 RepID=UPI001C8E86CB|nr:hypothetical protein [Bathymodiolus japonicus methanotrophic gill symbiont]
MPKTSFRKNGDSTNWLDGYSECNSCSSRVLLAHVESANCPVAYQGLKITTSLSYVSMIFSE